MNGASGRMGYRQHLVRSILAIREQGGVELADGRRVQVEPMLVELREGKVGEGLRKLFSAAGLELPADVKVENTRQSAVPADKPVVEGQPTWAFSLVSAEPPPPIATNTRPAGAKP